MGTVEIDCCPMHLEYRVNGKLVYRPCLTWEQTARESGDWFALLLPITMAPCNRFDEVLHEIYQRLNYFPIPQDDWAFIARYLADHVCCLPLNEETGETILPEEHLPMELSMEGGGTLYTARWWEDRGPITIYRQASSGRRMLEQLVPDPDGTWTAVHTPLTAEGQPIRPVGRCGDVPDHRLQ